MCLSQFSGGWHVGKDVAMLSTFDSSEARVGAMVAGVELQQKLLQRLRMLPGEASQAPDVDKKPSPLNSSPDEDRLEDLASEASRLRQQILHAKKERDLARRRRRARANPRRVRIWTGSASCSHLAPVGLLSLPRRTGSKNKSWMPRRRETLQGEGDIAQNRNR